MAILFIWYLGIVGCFQQRSAVTTGVTRYDFMTVTYCRELCKATGESYAAVHHTNCYCESGKIERVNSNCCSILLNIATPTETTL